MRNFFTVLVLAVAGCTGIVGNTEDAGASLDAGGDTGRFDARGQLDASVDAGDDDAGVDAGLDAGLDAGVDAGVDAGPPTSFYSTHLMVAFIGHSADLRGWVQTLKDSGYNHVWAHMDSYSEAYYPRDLRRFMDEAADAGIWVSPGTAGGMPASGVVQVVQDTINHPAMFKVGGKPVYADYGHNRTQYDAAVAMLAQQGVPRSSYLLMAQTLYPIQNGATWIEYGTGAPADLAAVNHAYDIDPNLDGLVNFAVDKGTSTAATAITRIINENTITTQSGRARGKLTMAGTNAFYASVQITDYGFAGGAQIWKAILDGAVRPELVNDVTANDYVELSYMAPLENPPVNGLSYVPVLGAGYVLGPTVRTPLLDHSGVQKFLRPWADAFVTGAAQPAFASDRMFAWYSLHPANAALIATIPSNVAALDAQFTQSWWSGAVYATGNSTVGGFNQVLEIRNRIAAEFGTIRMAAHLTAPAQLRINGTLSATFPAGPAYFEVPQVLGTPTFAIVRNNQAVRSGSGPQAITNSVWPGAWNCLITEIP